MIGATLGSYRILEKLGEGGMGEVYLADDERLRRRVALKVLPAAFANDPDRRQRFEREVRAVSALNHPNILTLFDLGRDGERYFMATEFIDGRTLREHLRERGKVPVEDAIDIVVQCAEALSCAHAGGIVHRDIKPENVMIRHDGYVKVLDFGLATTARPATPDATTQTMHGVVTTAGVVLGTMGYLSPEQARGQPIDARTDIFSLGVVFYEMLTGVPPFAGATPSDTMAAILREEPPPLAHSIADPPEALEHILKKALAKDREARYATALDFARDLRQLARDLASDTHRRPKIAARERPTAAAGFRSRRYVGAVATIAVVATLIVAALQWRNRASAPPPETARSNSELSDLRTLAVLPFQLLGYPDASEHVGLGMADALIGRLAILRQLTVRPTTAVQRYQGRETDVMAIGRELQVDAVLTGNVQRDAGRTRVTVQLVRCTAGADASTVWSDTFTASTNDPFEVQDGLATQLVEKLALQLSGDEQARLTARDTTSARARQRYMEGRFLFNKRTKDSVARAVELFDEAVREDPNYTRAHYSRALATNTLIELGALPAAAALPRVRDGVERALVLDPTFGQAYGLRSFLARVYDWKFDQAERDSKRAMDLDPNNPDVLLWRGIHLLALGRAEEAIALHAQAIAIDPLDMSVRTLLCRAFYFAGRYADAMKTAREVIDLDANQSAAHQWLGLSHVAQGHAEEALAPLTQGMALSNSAERTASLAYGYAKAGQPAEARKLIAKLTSSAGVGSTYFIATVHAGLGDREQALQWLERALRQRDAFLPNRIKLDPALDPLRQDPRFARLLKDTLG